MRRLYSDGCYNLAVAIIAQAVHDCRIKRKMVGRNQPWLELLQNDPEYYLFESEDEEYPSFYGVCGYLGVNPQLLRDKIHYALQTGKKEFYGTPEEMLMDKIADESPIMRTTLLRWATKKVCRNGRELNEMLRELVRDMVIVEVKAVIPPSKRKSKYYVWGADKAEE